MAWDGSNKKKTVVWLWYKPFSFRAHVSWSISHVGGTAGRRRKWQRSSSSSTLASLLCEWSAHKTNWQIIFNFFLPKPGSWELYNPHWSRSPPLGRLAPQYQWTPYERHKFKYSSMSMNTFTWDKGKVHKVGQRSPQRFAGVQESSRDSSEWLPWDWSFKQQREKFAWSTWVRGSSQTYPCPPSGEARRVSFHIRTLRTKTFHRKQTCEWENLRACDNPGLKFFNRICDNLGLPSLYVYMCFCQ